MSADTPESPTGLMEPTPRTTDVDDTDTGSAPPDSFGNHVLAALRLLAYTRFSLLSAGILLGLAVLPFWFSHPTVLGVYLLDRPWRLFHVSWAAVVAAALVITTWRTTYANAGERFNERTIGRWWETTSKWKWSFRTVWLLLLALPLPTVAMYSSLGEQGDRAWWLVLELAAGLLSGLAALFLVEVIHRWWLTPNLYDPRLGLIDLRFAWHPRSLKPPSEPNANAKSAEQHAVGRGSIRLHTIVASALKRLGPGYARKAKVWEKTGDGPRKEEFWVLQAGHGSLLSLLLVMLAAYFLTYWSVFWTGRFPDDRTQFATLFFLLCLLMLYTAILTGLAFLLDYVRVPTSVAIVGVATIWNLWRGPVDHIYEVAPPRLARAQSGMEGSPAPTGTFSDVPLTLDEVVAGWRTRQLRVDKSSPNRTFVIVTAAGGGIQAAAWTTRVLTRLHERHGARFTAAIGAISGVSGGSVGTLMYLPHYKSLLDHELAGRDEDVKRILANIHQQATRSSLEAVGWGFLFPDALRNVGLLGDPAIDRGWVQERIWARRMGESVPGNLEHPEVSDWRLGDLAAMVKSGDLPAVVFNTYAIDTGQRIWIAPFLLDAKAERERGPGDYLEFCACGGMQLRLSTAARLSASFPYVSPTARAGGLPCVDPKWEATAAVLRNVHLGDGGYTDNEGLLTALTLTQSLRTQYRDRPEAERPFDKVLILRIAPFPVTEAAMESELSRRVVAGEVAAAEPDAPWIQSLFGPLEGMYAGRQSTQLERGRSAVQLWTLLADAEMQLYKAQQAGKTARDGLKKVVDAVASDEVQTELDRLDDAFRRDLIQAYRELAELQFHLEEMADQNRTQRADGGHVPIALETVLIDYTLAPNSAPEQPPLSWRLSTRQIYQIDDGWRYWEQSKARRLASFGPVQVPIPVPSLPFPVSVPLEVQAPRAPDHAAQRAKLDVEFPRKAY